MRAIVVFGATLTSDGGASAAIARRVRYAWQSAQVWPEAPILCSGASRYGLPSEAAVMARLLIAGGIPKSLLSLDESSRDTLQTAVVAAKFLRQEQRTKLVVCTEAYHMPRARMLLHRLGAATESGCQAGRPADAPMAYWLRMQLREALALPYDLAVVSWRLRQLRALALA